MHTRTEVSICSCHSLAVLVDGCFVNQLRCDGDALCNLQHGTFFSIFFSSRLETTIMPTRAYIQSLSSIAPISAKIFEVVERWVRIRWLSNANASSKKWKYLFTVNRKRAKRRVVLLLLSIAHSNVCIEYHLHTLFAPTLRRKESWTMFRVL
jgi:hypothetical protein